MSERTLVSVRTIDSVEPIPGADNIEAVDVGGWTVVARKGEFEAGDRAMYFEIDSCLPLSDSRFSFLKPNRVLADGTEAHRLKTIRLRGVYSQGLALPIEQFDDVMQKGATGSLQERLGVVKWEPPVGKFGLGVMRPMGTFPTHLVRKTDSERVQNLTKWWSKIITHDFYATEKVDGTSLTVVRSPDGELIVASRNWAQHYDENVYWKAVEAFQLDRIEPGEAVQAEIYGPGLQGNPLKQNELSVAVFSFSRNNAGVARQDWPEWVHDVGAARVYQLILPATVKEAIEQVDGIRSLINPDRLAEGVVWWEEKAAPIMELDWRSNFKVISNKYLVKNDG